MVKLFLTDEKPGGRGKVGGPMYEVNHDSLEYMTQKDLYAIAAYLKTTTDLTPTVQLSAATSREALGKEVYQTKCAACHDTGSAGAPKIGDSMAWQTRLDKQGRDQLYYNAIHGIGAMAARGLCQDAVECPDNYIHAAVDHILANSIGGNNVIQSTRKLGEKPKRIGFEEGKKIYDTVCSTCHANGNLGAPKIGDRQTWEKRQDKGMEVLFDNVIHAYPKSKDPEACVVTRGACKDCTDAELIAAVKYMVQQSLSGSVNVSQW